jgi:hypothetical protein
VKALDDEEAEAIVEKIEGAKAEVEEAKRAEAEEARAAAREEREQAEKVARQEREQAEAVARQQRERVETVRQTAETAAEIGLAGRSSPALAPVRHGRTHHFLSMMVRARARPICWQCRPGQHGSATPCC